MNLKIYQSLVHNLSKNVKIWFSFVVILLFSNLFLSIYLVNIDTREKTIVTPPSIDRAFWVKGSQVSPSYLEMITTYFSSLLLTYQPLNCEARFRVLLEYIHPTTYAYLKSEMDLEIDKITRQKMSSVFFPTSIEVDGMEVIIEGRLLTYLGKKSVGDKNKKYKFVYSYENSGFYINAYSEVIE